MTRDCHINTADISLNNFNWLVFVRENQCVFCEVGFQFLGALPKQLQELTLNIILSLLLSLFVCRTGVNTTQFASRLRLAGVSDDHRSKCLQKKLYYGSFHVHAAGREQIKKGG